MTSATATQSIIVKAPDANSMEMQEPEVRADSGHGVIRGRVVLDGVAVDAFDVIVTKTLDDLSEPRSFRTRTGRFAVGDIEPGTWIVIVTGSSFVRRLPTQDIVAGQIIDLGDVAVRRGFTFEGRVVDANGTAVRGATVTVTNARRQSRHTITDASGRYRFDDVTSGDLTGFAPQLIAVSQLGERSLTLSVPSGDANVDLVVLPTGGIEGTVTGALDLVLIVWAQPVGAKRAVYSATIDMNGRYQFDSLPIGDYDILLLLQRGQVLSSARVSVVEATSTAAAPIPVTPP